jgi:hypothetical protein
MTRKTEFWWASIHGADPEPVEKAKRDGRPCVFTSGCADPFFLEEDPSAVVFVQEMSRPEHPDKVAARRAALANQRKTYIFRGKRIAVPFSGHGWRGPR